MGVYKDKRSGLWRIRVELGTSSDGKRLRPHRGGSYRTKKEADAKHAEIMHKQNEGAYIEPSKQTVRDFLVEWIEATESGTRYSTWKAYEIKARCHLIPYLGAIPLRALEPSHLNKLYADLLKGGRKDGKGGLSSRTVIYAHVTMHKALQDAVRWGRLSRNVADLASPPAHVAKEMRVWNAEQARAFLIHVREHRLYPAFALALSTGMRRGEILGLRWSDVDLAGGSLSVRQTLIQIGYETRISEPKTKRSRRRIALDPATLEALRAHAARQGDECKAWGDGWTDTGLVFTREDGHWIHPDHLSSTFRRLCREASVPVIRFQDLRHTYATLALQGRVHPKVVSERLGHASISITLDTYSHVIPGMQEEAASVVAGMIF